MVNGFYLLYQAGIVIVICTIFGGHSYCKNRGKWVWAITIKAFTDKACGVNYAVGIWQSSMCLPLNGASGILFSYGKPENIHWER